MHTLFQIRYELLRATSFMTYLQFLFGKIDEYRDKQAPYITITLLRLFVEHPTASRVSSNLRKLLRIPISN